MRSAFELFQYRVGTMLDAEHVMRDALVEMGRLTAHPDVSSELISHADQSLDHVDRLEQVCRATGIDTARNPSSAFRGVVDEFLGIAKRYRPSGEVLDALAVSTALAAEHLEIAEYQMLAMLARFEGAEDAAAMLEETRREEEQAASRLTQLLGVAIDALADRNVEGTLRQAAMALEREMVREREPATMTQRQPAAPSRRAPTGKAPARQTPKAKAKPKPKRGR